MSAVFDEHVVVARSAIRDGGVAVPPGEHPVVAVASRRQHRRQSGSASETEVPPRRRSIGADRNESHRVARRELPELHRSAATTVTGQDESAETGPVGPSRIGVSPVKSRAPIE